MYPRPFVAVIGRPNVGKSTLFNRLIGRRVAVVQDEPGVTRDRNYYAVEYCGTPFTLVDTGGMTGAPPARPSPPRGEGDGERLLADVQRQTDLAIQEADRIIYLMDGRDGLLPIDREIAERLRKIDKPVWYAVNKIDGPKHEAKVMEFYQLGVERLFPISAEHGYGVDELLEAAIPRAEPRTEPTETGTIPRVVVLGRPNAGKSTLINTLLGEERLVTSDVPGTTRDTIDTLVERGGKTYRFVDTAGLRRRGKVSRGVEHFSAERARDALARADIALILIDATEGVVDQETKIVGEVLAAGRACALVINKWDLKPPGETERTAFLTEVTRRFAFVEHAPVLFISALKGAGVGKIFSIIDDVMTAYTTRVSTGDLNRFFEGVVRDHPPPLSKGRPVRLNYITQAGVKPPTFVVFASDAKAVATHYRRYLENALRQRFGFRGTPIRIVVRSKRSR
ncbi:MAG: ribosome biogenesis GTPase Der [Nitrospirota bacterium]